MATTIRKFQNFQVGETSVVVEDVYGDNIVPPNPPNVVAPRNLATNTPKTCGGQLVNEKRPQEHLGSSVPKSAPSQKDLYGP